MMCPSHLPYPMPRRPSLVDILSGFLGDAVIRAVLMLARAWARLTRSTWHG